VDGDAGSEHHRQPQKPALLLGLKVAGEGGEERNTPRLFLLEHRGRD
jgi:hypothetical protein